MVVLLLLRGWEKHKSKASTTYSAVVNDDDAFDDDAEA
jgi:hypothetical protein